MDPSRELLTYTLNIPADDTDTLQLKDNPRFAIRDRIVYLPDKNDELRKVLTVSQKEILLVLLQHGRLTEFNDASCNINALKDQVKLRQNIVAWSENLNWVWPDGDPAEWIYVLNTDPVSAAKTGYEGSNTIYLGQNKFADYYNDHKVVLFLVGFCKFCIFFALATLSFAECGEFNERTCV